MVTFIGTGLLGSNFTKAMLKKNEQVNVWNRTASKAKALEESGAKAFDEVAESVKGATRIHLALSDDEAVNETLKAAMPGFTKGVIIIDHSTTSTKGAVERTERFKKLGYTYLHAPVFMGPQNALESTGYMLVSGEQDVIAKMEPVLSVMTGKLLNYGPETGKAAALKLLGNSFLLFLTMGLSDTLALAKSMNIPPSDLLGLLGEWNPGAMTPARLKRVIAADYDNPSWELGMARKDARLMMEEAAAANQHLAVLPAIAAEMDQWIKKDHAHSDWTVVAKDNL